MPLPLAALLAGVGTTASSALQGGMSMFSAQQSQDFAEDYAKKKYQWMVKDLRKAGLNPILAVSGMSAGAPPMGAQFSFPDVGQAALSAVGEIAGAEEAHAGAGQKGALQEVAEAERELVKGQTDKIGAEIRSLHSLINKNIQDTATSAKQADLMNATMDKMQTEMANIRSQTRVTNAQAALAEADAAFYNTELGRDMRAVERGANTVRSVMDAINPAGWFTRRPKDRYEPGSAEMGTRRKETGQYHDRPY